MSDSTGEPAAVPVGVLLLDADGTIRTADATAATILRSDTGALTGKSLFSLASGEEAREGLRRGIEQSLRGEAGIRAVALVFAADRPAEPGFAEAAEVAARVKHDVNNLLMGLLGYVTLLRDRAELQEPARRKIELIEEQGKKIRDRVADLDTIRRLGGTTT